MASTLSSGQKKLLKFALILVAEPRVLLLDKPTGGINPTMINYLSERIRPLNERGITFLVVEHHMEFVMNLCDRMMVMYRGCKIAEGTPAEVRANRRSWKHTWARKVTRFRIPPVDGAGLSQPDFWEVLHEIQSAGALYRRRGARGKGPIIRLAWLFRRISARPRP
jgi:ABC-type multidrug transport system ATPase subunit